MLKKIVYSLLIICGIAIVFNSVFALTSPLLSSTGKEIINSSGIDVSEDGEGTDVKLAGRIGDILKVVLNFLGIIILIFVLYGGFLWLTAGGNTEQVDKAQSLLLNTFKGAIIIGLAYVITSFVIYYANPEQEFSEDPNYYYGPSSN